MRIKGARNAKLTLPLDKEAIYRIEFGRLYYISGFIHTARDQAHKRICQAIRDGSALPFDLKDACIYYAGPTPHNPDSPFAFGSVGPTTSLRMDAWTPLLLENGVRILIGKGQRSESVKSCIEKNNAIYFSTIGGAGAYLSSCVKSAELIAYEDLGCEAIYRLYVEDFPVFRSI
ncbi:MAG TPA: TRZ/ATZ family protein [Spirochaetaceae bacterium]|nr:TRZ/ATZ family protein [Spirochaetaceae bacterium]